MKKIEWEEGIECCMCVRENDTYIQNEYGEIHCLECYEEMKEPKEYGDYPDTVRERHELFGGQ